MTSGLDIRPLRPDDIEAELDLRRRAFGAISAAQLPGWTASVQAGIDAGQILGVFDRTRLVASARYHSMVQWWHGQSMPMAGVAGVKVAPEERGRGVGRALMSELLGQIAGRGYPVSALYPTTLPVYRSLGWELAGGRYETLLPARSLGRLAPADPHAGQGSGEAPAPRLRRATAGDGAAVIDTLGRVHQALRDCGPGTREPADLTDWLADENHFAYLADDGFLSYRWANGTAELQVDWAVAASAATTRAFWQILASYATMAQTIRACLGPRDPVGWLLTEPAGVTKCAESWMLRLLDPAQAIAARGYPSAAAVSVQLELTDHAMPDLSGRWRLEVSGGAGKLVRCAGPGPHPLLRLGARGLAAMFAGVPVATLRQVGLASGGDQAADEALDCAFAGVAFMNHYF